MGASSSAPLDKNKYDEKNFEFEVIDENLYDGYLSLKWDCVPDPIKHELIIEIIKKFSLEDLEKTNELYFEKFYAVLRHDDILKRSPGICVSYKWPILVALKHLNIKRKYILQKSGLWWRVSFLCEPEVSDTEQKNL